MKFYLHNFKVQIVLLDLNLLLVLCLWNTFKTLAFYKQINLDLFMAERNARNEYFIEAKIFYITFRFGNPASGKFMFFTFPIPSNSLHLDGRKLGYKFPMVDLELFATM